MDTVDLSGPVRRPVRRPAPAEGASTTTAPEDAHRALRLELRQELLRLAHDEDAVATHEAEGAHYWEPLPLRVSIHRQCAAALRAAADELAAAVPPEPPLIW